MIDDTELVCVVQLEPSQLAADEIQPELSFLTFIPVTEPGAKLLKTVPDCQFPPLSILYSNPSPVGLSMVTLPPVVGPHREGCTTQMVGASGVAISTVTSTLACAVHPFAVVVFVTV